MREVDLLLHVVGMDDGYVNFVIFSLLRYDLLSFINESFVTN